MPYKKIKFSPRSAPFKPVLGRFLPGGYWVNKTIFDAVWAQVNKNLPPQGCRAKHTAKSICGHVFWHKYGFGDQIKLGRCLKFFVANKRLPLRLINPTKKGPRRYVRDDS